MRADMNQPDRYLNAKNRIFRKGRKDIIVCDFDRVFNIEKKNLNIFYVTKTAYYNHANDICNTLNMFMAYYDEDHELITSYVNIKALIDLNNLTYTYVSFMDDITNRLFTPSMVKKIQTFVEEQYRISLETSPDKEKYENNPQQFTDVHGKILMSISTALKILIPLICHYYVVRQLMIKDITQQRYLYNSMYAIFPLFEQGVNIYNKLYATVERAVARSMHQDAPMWKRSKNKGITPTNQKTELAQMIIRDLMYKYNFTSIMINLNFASIKLNLRNLVEGKDTHDYAAINTQRSSNKSLSGLEQLEMNAARIDERDIIIASQGSHSRVKRLSAKYNVIISKKELDFYEAHMEISQAQNQSQIKLILQFFAEDFGGTENTKFIKRMDFYRLIIIMKTILERAGFRILPDLLTGNISKKIRGRKIGNKKINKVKNSPRYINLMEQYSNVRDVVTDDLVLKELATFINVPMTYVNHLKPGLLGEEIEINEDIIIDECIRFLEMI